MEQLETNIKIILGQNIRKYRELRGLTQEQLIEKLNIGVSTLSNIECGKSFPNLANLNKIIKTLDIKPDMLFVNNNNNNDDVYDDFEKRFSLIKNNKEKFEILYGVLKVLS